ncbi:hypothetical protein C5C66_01035 [Rathayibacter toxicus]|nr:hypothetical protein TI83_01250 [Rathayibacter toxicus]ALS57247.1 hypothetical protein APU90_05240 [Rathayibacter toxicus]PPI51122.1 hypothetical protein C5C66_01035 [Rathayibacter toxicus]
MRNGLRLVDCAVRSLGGGSRRPTAAAVVRNARKSTDRDPLLTPTIVGDVAATTSAHSGVISRHDTTARSTSG